jgi:hypothetical protein
MTSVQPSSNGGAQKTVKMQDIQEFSESDSLATGKNGGMKVGILKAKPQDVGG